MNITGPIKDFFEEAGALSIFTGRFFRELFRPRFEFN